MSTPQELLANAEREQLIKQFLPSSIWHHLVMLNDGGRAEFYRDALQKYAPGEHVLDLGAGSGLLSVRACPRNPSRVSNVAGGRNGVTHSVRF